jgi:hypothetical protein
VSRSLLSLKIIDFGELLGTLFKFLAAHFTDYVIADQSGTKFPQVSSMYITPQNHTPNNNF